METFCWRLHYAYYNPQHTVIQSLVMRCRKNIYTMADLLSCVKKTSTYGTCWSLLSTLQLYYLTGLTENVVYKDDIVAVLRGLSVSKSTCKVLQNGLLSTVEPPLIWTPIWHKKMSILVSCWLNSNAKTVFGRNKGVFIREVIFREWDCNQGFQI